MGPRGRSKVTPAPDRSKVRHVAIEGIIERSSYARGATRLHAVLCCSLSTTYSETAVLLPVFGAARALPY